MISHLRPRSNGKVLIQDVSQNSTCKIALSVSEIHLSNKKSWYFGAEFDTWKEPKARSESGVVTEELELSHIILCVG